MRIHLTFTPSGETGFLPINYNTYVSEFVYELLQPDVPFRAKPEAQEGVSFYTFSNLYIPEVQQEDRILRFGKVPIELTISLLVDLECETEVAERVQSISSLQFDANAGTDLNIAKVEILNEPTNFTSLVRFRMLSPLASPMWDAEDSRSKGASPEQRYIHYNDQEFSDSIRGILLAKYERWKGKRPIDTRFRFTLDEKYVQRRRGRISKLVAFHEGESDEKKVKAIVAPFEVEGNPELIWLGYVAGFGEKNLLGFGCSDIVSISQPEPRRFDKRANGGAVVRRNPALERQFAPQGRPQQRREENRFSQPRHSDPRHPDSGRPFQGNSNQNGFNNQNGNNLNTGGHNGANHNGNGNHNGSSGRVYEAPVRRFERTVDDRGNANAPRSGNSRNGGGYNNR